MPINNHKVLLLPYLNHTAWTIAHVSYKGWRENCCKHFPLCLVCRSCIPAFYTLDFHSFSSGRPSLSVELNCTVVLASVICVKLTQLMSHWHGQPNISAEQESLSTLVGCHRSGSEAQKLLPFALPLGISASRFSQGPFHLAQ